MKHAAIGSPKETLVVRFQLGQVVVTPGALVALSRTGITPLDLLKRHLRGDWGELTPEDHQLNDAAVTRGLRILSSYVVGRQQKVWIITEADRSITTLLLPDEY